MLALRRTANGVRSIFLATASTLFPLKINARSFPSCSGVHGGLDGTRIFPSLSVRSPQVRQTALCHHKRKAARRRPSEVNRWIAYAAFSAIAFFRRYAMKPMPANPRIIMAQVEGSGTAGVTSSTRVMDVISPKRFISI